MRPLNMAGLLFALGLFIMALIGFAGVTWTVNTGNNGYGPPPKPTVPKNAGVIQLGR